MKPMVSILCASFNHERFVGMFIESVLAQTNPNWELIIVDDCSKDNNVNEIKKYSDKRIKFIQHKFNMGINCAINTAFENSTGEYIALSGSDDMLCPDYIENLINTMDCHKDINVVYTDLQMMDYNGDIIPNSFYYNSKETKNQILRKLILEGNCLLSPGMAVRRQAFQHVYPLDIAMSQNQDYKIHIDLLLRNDFIIMDKPCLMYRQPSEKSGISFVNSETIRRRNLEENILMDSTLSIKDEKTLRDIFGKDIDEFGSIKTNLIPYILGMLALKYGHEYKKIWGYNQIVKFIQDPKNYVLVQNKYGFCFKDFLNLAKYFEIPKAEQGYKKYKRLFNIMIIVLVVYIILSTTLFCLI